MAKRIHDISKRRNLMNFVDLQSTIMSGATGKGKRLSVSELNQIFLQNKYFLEKTDIIRLLTLIRYYCPTNDITELTEQFGGIISFDENDHRLIEYFSVENSLIDEEDMKKFNKEIILFRNKHKYHTKEEDENKNDKRYLCVK